MLDLTQAIELRLQVGRIYTVIAFLRNEMSQSYSELVLIMKLGQSINSNPAREIRNQIFGYRVEIASLRVRAQTMLEKAHSIPYPDGT